MIIMVMITTLSAQAATAPPPPVTFENHYPPSRSSERWAAACDGDIVVRRDFFADERRLMITTPEGDVSREDIERIISATPINEPRAAVEILCGPETVLIGVNANGNRYSIFLDGREIRQVRRLGGD